MSGFSLFSSLVRSLAWPVAVVVLGISFHKQLASVIEGLGKRMKRLKTLKAGPAELSFEDQLADVKAESEKLSPRVPIRHRLAAEPKYDLRPSQIGAMGSSGAAVSATVAADAIHRDSLSSRARLTAMNIREAAGQTAPGVTVLNAWSCLEALIRELAGQFGITDEFGSFALLADQVITELDRLGALPAPDQTRQVVQRLLHLKLEVQRGVEASRLAAINYAETVLNTVDLLVAAYVTTRGESEQGLEKATADER